MKVTGYFGGALQTPYSPTESFCVQIREQKCGLHHYLSVGLSHCRCLSSLSRCLVAYPLSSSVTQTNNHQTFIQHILTLQITSFSSVTCLAGSVSTQALLLKHNGGGFH